MKVLIVEDFDFKRDQVITILKQKNIDYAICEYVNDALKYICENKETISGIILDLGLKTFKSSNDYNSYRGLDIVQELERIKLYIPILINSTTVVDMLEKYPFVYGQRTNMRNYEMLEKFIAFLTEKEEQ